MSAIPFVDGRRLEAGTILRAEVCIVGAGAAGITLALDLAARGRDVLLLESGGLAPEADTQRLLSGDTADSPLVELGQARLACFGGTTALWAGWCRPLDPIDFEPRDWVPHSGWPFAAADLEPYYRRAHPVCGLGEFDYRPARWQTPATRPVELTGGEIGSALFQLSPRLDFGLARRERIEASRRLTCVLHATALELELTSSGGAVSGVRLALPGGRETRAEAAVVALAAGGIENPRLLLLSDRQVPGGIGNRHDLVGRYFMEHPYVNSGLLHSSAGPAPAFYRPHAVTGWPGGRVCGVFTLPETVVRREGLLNVAVFLRPAWRGDPVFQTEAIRSGERLAAALRRGYLPPGAVRAIAGLAARPDRLARAAWRRLAARGAGTASLRAFTEPVPDPRHRVTLVAARDAVGRRRVKVDWRPGDLELRSLRRAHELLDQALRRAGLGRLEVALGEGGAWPPPLSGACHHMGTTRMHPDPRQGVTDADGRVHGIANLYLAGSSLFPTAGHANPTLTIVALALRLADRLHGALRVSGGARMADGG